MKKFISLAGIVVCICCFSAASAQHDIFVKFSGINGTSTAIGFTAYSEVVKTGLVNTSCATTGGTGSCANAFGNFNFQMAANQVTPLLQARLFQGTTIAAVDFVFRKFPTSGNSFVYYQIHLEGVRLASVAEVGDGSDDPSEQYALSFLKVAWKYTPQNQSGGAGTSTLGCWDITTNTGGAGSNCSGYTFPF